MRIVTYPSSAAGEVAAPVTDLLRDIAVECATVAFHDQPTVDEQIHPPHASKLDLQRGAIAQAPQHQPNECLRTCFGSRVDELAQWTVAPGKSIEDRVEIVSIDQTEVQGAVETRDGDPGRLTATGLRERLHQIGLEVRTSARGIAPVRPYASMSTRQARVRAIELQVGLVGGQGENTKGAEK